MTPTTTPAGKTVSPAVRAAICTILAINAQIAALDECVSETESCRLLSAKTHAMLALEVASNVEFFDLLKAVDFYEYSSHPFAATVRQVVAEIEAGETL